MLAESALRSNGVDETTIRELRRRDEDRLAYVPPEMDLHSKVRLKTVCLVLVFKTIRHLFFWYYSTRTRHPRNACCCQKDILA